MGSVNRRMTQRFRNSDDIVGQFLPKIYTRRITLEDTKVPNRFASGLSEGASQDRRFRPGTAITVDCQIRDVLNEEGLGVITNNQNPDEDPNQVQDEILSSLKVAVLLFSDNAAFETMLNTIRSFNAFGWRLDLPSIMPTFENYLQQTVQSLNRTTEKVVLQIKDARPDTLGFEVRNSQYQEYDINNNLVNIIPYEHTFKVENLFFGRCENLSMICFTYFDFSSLSLDELSSEEVRRLGYMTGDITADVITRGNRVESTALVYKDAITKVPYYGPVHSMGNGTLMTGLSHRDSSRALTTHQVPLTKIQDFRSMERLKETNYQPSEFQTFDDSIPSLDLIEKNYKDFFDVEEVVVDFDRIEKVANIEFIIDMASIYEQTRYYDLVKSNPTNVMLGYPALLDILEITVLRRRVTKRLIGHNKLGAPTRIPFDQMEEEDFVVATSGQNAAATGGVSARNIVTKEDRDSKIVELAVPGWAGVVKRKFFIEDRQVADYLGTGAVFQYGIKLRIKDPTKDRFINLLQTARRNLKELNLYLQESSIPVFDSRMIRKTDPTQPVGMDEVRDPPQYGETLQQGNYNTVSKLLVTDFVRRARRKYNLQGYVDNYVELIDVAFAKSEVSMYNFSNPVQGNDGERGIVNEGNFAGISARPKDLLMSREGMSMDAANTAMYNMINPSNARPETIQSFIKTYQDLVMDLEDYFDIGYKFSLSNEGSGYSARGDNTLSMQRWFSNVEENPDGSTDEERAIESDNYIEMDPLQKVFFRFWREGDLQRGMGIPEVSEETYEDRLNRERAKFFPGGAVDAAMDRITPMSIVIGDDEVFFDEDEMNREEQAARAREKAEDLRRQQEAKSHHEAKRLGREPSRPKMKRKRRKRRAILAAPEQGRLISNFVQEIKMYQKRYGAPSANGIIGAMNKSDHHASDSGENSSIPSYNVYFNFMSSVTEEMADASFKYSNSIKGLEESNRTLSDTGIEEFISSNVACGLMDNRPDGNDVVNEDNRFNREEGMYPGLLNFIRQVPVEEIPQIPQTSAPNFPTGRIFAESARSFRNDRVSLPTTVLPLPPAPVANPAAPQLQKQVSISTNVDVGAVKVKGSKRGPSPRTGMQTRSSAPPRSDMRSTMTSPAVRTATRTTASTASRASRATSTQRVSRAPSASSRATSRVRTATPRSTSYNRAPASTARSSGPTTSAYRF